MPDFGIFRGFSESAFSDKLFAGKLPTELGNNGYIGILDLYINASAAYSLRLLRNAYTGASIRVRRSSDNTEQNIGFTATGGLDTSALTSFCGASNGFVTTWYDQSNNGNNVTQTTAINQPQIVQNGIILYGNNKPTIKFDGINDNLGTTFTNVPIFPITMTTISNTTGITDAGLIGFGNAGSLRREFWQEITSSGKVKFGYYGDDLPNGFATGIFNNIQLLYTAIVTNTFVQNGYGNGNLAGTYNSSSQYIGNGAFNIGKGRQDSLGKFINGNIQEVIIYPIDQSSNRTNIESNINSYYGIY
jgi:hypothetical protein